MNHLRSADWYEGNDRNAYIHRAWMRRGNPEDALDGTKPQIAIANTASDLTPCNMHLNEVAESVKQGVWAAGGVPYNLPGRLARRDAGQADRDAVAQHGRDGDGGDVPRQPDRRARAARRLRQDDSGAADGRGIRRHPRDRRPRRADADRPLPRRGARLRHRRLAAQRRGPRRHDLERAVHRVRAVDDPRQGPLQHDGHGVDDGRRRRGARHDDPRLRGHARRRRAAALAVARHRPAHRRHGRGRTASPATS